METLHELLDDPCLFCGYNGAGYFQAGTHGKECPWHNLGGGYERIEAFPGVLKELIKKRDKLLARVLLDAPTS